MNKRFFAALLCLPFAVAGFAAQLTATLQSGDKLTPFYGDSAFVKAYDAAVDGDVITLSSGYFKSTEIKKGITVIGAYAFGADASKYTGVANTTVSADNVTLEGVYISYLTIKGTDNLTINRGRFFELLDVENGDKKYHSNTIITDCLINSCDAMSLSKNMVLRKCAIDYFNDLNESSNLALIENCYVNLFASYEHPKHPYAVYNNNILRLYSSAYFYNDTHSITLAKPSEFHHNIFDDSNYWSSSSSGYKKWDIYWSTAENDNNSVTYSYSQTSSGSAYFRTSGTKGTVGHKDYPAIPEIESSDIDSETDAEGNIHVKISAKPRD